MESTRQKSLPWLWCVLLALPALIPLAMHFWFAASEGHHATGFIQNDQPYYMANAREFFDAEEFSLAYKNPNDWRTDSPKIYFQPQTIVLGAIHQVTKLDPALIFNLFGFLFAVLTVRVAWLLMQEFLPDRDGSKLLLVLFMWGGGLFAIAGVLASLFSETELDLYDRLTMFDPFQGWWFLNLGRNLIFPLEAYYHFLFLAGMLMLIRGRHFAAVAIGFLISISHPFTGVEYLAILTGGLFLERVLWRQKSTPWSAIVAAAGLFVLHVGYYQIWLNQFPTHHELHNVWKLAWELDAVPMLLAYGVVGLFAMWGLRSLKNARQFASLNCNRIALIWFACAFLLANHEWFMKPIQPLHFTRGYVWTPIFLAGAAALHQLIAWLDDGKKSGFLVLALVACFLLDNATWLCVCQIDGENNSAHTATDFRTCMKELNDVTNDKAVVVSNSRLLSYLATVYTHHDAFAGHGYLTPNVKESSDAIKALQRGELIEELKDYPQLILLEVAGKRSWDLDRMAKTYAENGFTIAKQKSGQEYDLLYCVPAENRQQLGKPTEN